MKDQPNPVSGRPMTVSRFATLADAYGGDIGRWPAGERGPAADDHVGEPGRLCRVEHAAQDATRVHPVLSHRRRVGTNRPVDIRRMGGRCGPKS